MAHKYKTEKEFLTFGKKISGTFSKGFFKSISEFFSGKKHYQDIKTIKVLVKTVSYHVETLTTEQVTEIKKVYDQYKYVISQRFIDYHDGSEVDIIRYKYLINLCFVAYEKNKIENANLLSWCISNNIKVVRNGTGVFASLYAVTNSEVEMGKIKLKSNDCTVTNLSDLIEIEKYSELF